MKYIKSKGIFEMTNGENDSNIIFNLEDISLDLKDDGFRIEVTNFKDRPWERGLYVLEVRIKKGESQWMYLPNFHLSDVYPCVKRMVDYMSGEGYGCSIFAGIGKNWTGIKLPQSEKSFNNDRSSINVRVYDYITLKFSYKSGFYAGSAFNTLTESVDSNVVSDVKDICLDLSDNNFSIDIKEVGLFDLQTHNMPIKTTYTKSPINVLTIKSNIDRGNGFMAFDGFYYVFDYNEVEEVINRIKEYLGDKIINIKMMNLSFKLVDLSKKILTIKISFNS